MILVKHLGLSSLLAMSVTGFYRTAPYLGRFSNNGGRSPVSRFASVVPSKRLSVCFAKQSGQKSATAPQKRGMVPKYVPKSENQHKYVDALDNSEIPLVFVLGPAGTGKTLFACLTAIQGLRSGDFDRIILTRPLVTVEEELGFLPGNIKSKMDPWTRPIFDIFLEYYSQKDIDAMLNAGLIEIAPLAFMRGRTFKRCFILADEMQNSSPAQMLMAATRIGFGSKMVVNGDLNQSDRGTENGLAVMIRKVRAAMDSNTNISGISICDLEAEDIERSPIVSTILQIMTPEKNNNVTQRMDLTPKDHVQLDDAALIPLHLSALKMPKVTLPFNSFIADKSAL